MQGKALNLPSGLVAMWMLGMQNKPGYRYYLNFIITGSVSCSALEQSLQGMISAHPSLSPDIIFTEEGFKTNRDISSVPCVSIINQPEISAETLACRFGPDLNSDTDLSMSACIVKARHNKILLHLTVHHLCADAWSMALLMQELGNRYKAALEGRVFDKVYGNHHLNFHDWLAYREVSMPNEIQLAHDFWAPMLDGAPNVHSLPGTVGSTLEIGHFSQSLSSSQSEAICSVAASFRMTFYMLMQSLFSLALAQVSKVDSVITMTPLSRRAPTGIKGDANLFDTIGCLTNLVCIRFDLHETQLFTELLTTMRERIVSAFEHGDTDFADVVEVIKPEAMPGRNPVSQIIFTHRNIPERTLELEKCQVNRVPDTREHPRLELEVEVQTANGQTEIDWLWQEQYINHESVMNVSSLFTHLINECCTGKLQTMTISDITQTEVSERIDQPV